MAKMTDTGMRMRPEHADISLDNGAAGNRAIPTEGSAGLIADKPAHMKRRQEATMLVGALLGLVLTAAMASTVAAAECSVPDSRDDGWQVATPESVGIDGATLCPLADRFEEWKEANLHGVLVIRRGKLVYERYFTGFDRLHATGASTVTFNAETKHDLRSMTKSFTALVIGAAAGRGWLDVDQPVLTFFPDFADLRSSEKDQVTVRHLLMMASGLEWNDDPPFTN